MGYYVSAHVPCLHVNEVWPELSQAVGVFVRNVPLTSNYTIVFMEPIETRVGPKRQKISLSQSIPWPKKQALQKNILSSEIKALKAQEKGLRLDLVTD